MLVNTLCINIHLILKISLGGMFCHYSHLGSITPPHKVANGKARTHAQSLTPETELSIILLKTE